MHTINKNNTQLECCNLQVCKFASCKLADLQTSFLQENQGLQLNFKFANLQRFCKLSDALKASIYKAFAKFASLQLSLIYKYMYEPYIGSYNKLYI